MILINSSPKNALKIFQQFLPIFVPIGLGCLLAAAERKRIKVGFIDEQIEEDVFGIVEKYVKQMQKPYIFGFSVLTASFKNALTVSGELKKRYPDSMIVFGGIHPTAMSGEVMSYGHIDFVLRGEGEKSLFELYDCIKEKKDYSGIDGLSYRKDGCVIHNPHIFVLDALDSYPSFPYHKFTSKRYDLGFVISSRGCPYRCIFCSNRLTTGRKFRYRSAGKITEELEMLYGKYERKFALFLDDNLLVSKERIYELISAIKQKCLHKKMTFSFQARGDNVNLQLLKDMYDSGFRSIFFGMETSSNRIMKIIKKDETVEECCEAVRMAKKIGYHVSATFIYGLPTESYQDRMDCAALSKELNIDMVRYNNATPYPGTELYEIAQREKRLHIKGLYENFISVSTFIENPFKKTAFSYIPEGSTENEIRRDILFSYFSFYLDIKRLKNILSHPNQGVGWFNAGEKLEELIRKIPGLLILGVMLFCKFCQLFYYMAINKDTAISSREFLKVFNGLENKKIYGMKTV